MDKQDALEEFLRRVAQRKFYTFEPYPWQKAFYAGGATQKQAMAMAANQVGKTLSAAFETAVHGTGEYPDWWEGHRVTSKNPLIWVSSLTNEVSRDIVQKELLGDVGEWGTGMIPKDRILDIKTRQAGIADVVDTIIVANKQGGRTTIKTKVAEQGWKKYQGTKVDFIWQDEEPDDFKVFTESLTRTVNTGGRIIVTFTPLSGPTELVQHFQEKSSEDPRRVGLYTATWDDSPHMTEEKKKELMSTYPAHELDARTKGIPMMGEGAVFPISDDQIKCEPFKLPDYYRYIAGVDFGIDHPAAGAWLAHDPDTDIVYFYDGYREAGQLPYFHGNMMRMRDPNGLIPVAWPHDGQNEEKGSGKNLKDQYLEQDINMMLDSARYDDDKGGSQVVEPIVQEIYTRMTDGRFKVFDNPAGHLFLEEKRGLYRKNGKIKAIKDDLFKATCYALMMLRWAAPKYIASQSNSSANRPLF